jgi:hypothetical protein
VGDDSDDFSCKGYADQAWPPELAMVKAVMA